MNAPDLMGNVIGFRSWVIDDEMWLASTAQSGIWKPGENVARCVHASIPTGGGMRFHVPTPGNHRAPDPTCGCGLYALHSVSDCERYAYDAGPAVVGAVVAWGRLCVHPTGFRAERAKVVAIAAMGGEARKPSESMLANVARVYGAKLVEPQLLELAATDFGSMVPESLRPDENDDSTEGVGIWQGQRIHFHAMTPASFHGWSTHIGVPAGTAVQLDPAGIKFNKQPAPTSTGARIWLGMVAYAIVYVTVWILFGAPWWVALPVAVAAQIGTFFADLWWQERKAA